MANPRYELRSPPVQELMRRKPLRFAFWGNALILAIFIMGLLSIKGIRLSQYRSAPAVIQKVTVPGGYIRLEATTHYDHSFSIRKGDTLLLQLNDAAASFQEEIRCKVLSAGTPASRICDLIMVSMDTVPAVVRMHLPVSGQICTIKISAGSQNIFSMIRQRFKW
jgi:hypothetical protein